MKGMTSEIWIPRMGYVIMAPKAKTRESPARGYYEDASG
jgi:hypothetical protein